MAANALTLQEVPRSKEVVDTEWRIERAEGVLSVRNIGFRTAHSVSALVRVDGERFDVTAGDVGSDETFECDAAYVYQAKVSSNWQAIESMASTGISYFPSSSLRIEARVTWQTAQGTPGVQVVTN